MILRRPERFVFFLIVTVSIAGCTPYRGSTPGPGSATSLLGGTAKATICN
jgi:hypothetical protein